MSASVRQTLADLRISLEVRLAALRNELTALEMELADAKAAEAALTPKVERLEVRGPQASQLAMGYWASQPPRPIRDMTMKELVRKALSEQFPNGATARQMLDFFHHAWGRTDIVRSSFSPQLSRLKGDDEITLDGMIWKLAVGEQGTECANDLSAIALDENGPVPAGSDDRDGGASDSPAPDFQPPTSDQERQVPA